SATGRPVSLFHTFTPPGYGFAIIDPDSDPPGRVLFHSQDGRNLREWMSDDLLNTPPLKKAISGRGFQEFSSAYLGRDHHVHAQPFVTFAGSPWILVVFSDSEYFRSALANVMRLTLWLLVIYTLLLLGVVYLRERIAARRTPESSPVNPLLRLW